MVDSEALEGDAVKIPRTRTSTMRLIRGKFALIQDTRTELKSPHTKSMASKTLEERKGQIRRHIST